MKLFLLPITCSCTEIHSVFGFLRFQRRQVSRPVWIWCSLLQSPCFSAAQRFPMALHTPLALAKPPTPSVSDRGNLVSSISCASYPIPDPPGSPALQEAWRSNGQCQMLLKFFRISYFFIFPFMLQTYPGFIWRVLLFCYLEAFLRHKGIKMNFETVFSLLYHNQLSLAVCNWFPFIIKHFV